MQPGIRVRHAPRKCHESRLHRGGGPTVCRGSLRTGVLPVQAAAGLRGGSIGRAKGEAAGLMIEDQGLQKPAGADRPRARDTVANVVKASDRKPRCPCHSLILLALAHRGQAPPRGRSAGAGGGPSNRWRLSRRAAARFAGQERHSRSAPQPPQRESHAPSSTARDEHALGNIGDDQAITL